MPAGCFASLPWNLKTCGVSAKGRREMSAPTYATMIDQIQRELAGLENRIDAVSPNVLHRDSRRRMDALRMAAESAEGSTAVFVCHMTVMTGK